jgi:hypothetical protein
MMNRQWGLGIGVTVGIAGLIFACGSSKLGASTGAGGGPGSTGMPCPMEGQTQACHILIDTQPTHVDCVVGTQTCMSGMWTNCSSPTVKGQYYGGSFSSPGYQGGFPPANGATAARSGGNAAAGAKGQLGILADPAPPLPDASICVANPCDPYCLGWDDEGGAPANAQQAGGGTVAGLPPGIYSGATNPACTIPTTLDNCNFDQCCPSAGGTCANWSGPPPPTGDCIPCAGVDFTAGIACDDPVTGDTVVTVCNRGATAAPTTMGPLYVGIGTKKPGQMYPFGPNGGNCQVDLSMVPMNPNTCINIDINNPATGIKCFGINLSPMDRIVVNGGGGNGAASSDTDMAITECTMDNNFGEQNHQTCPAATGASGGGATIYICGDPAGVPAGMGNGVCHPGNTPPAGCLLDTCCYKNGNGGCIPWDKTISGDCDLMNDQGAGCDSKPDYTAAASCSDINGDVHVDICNRGAQDVSSGQFYVGIGAAGSTYGFPFSNDLAGAAYCTWNWSAVGGLDADGCVDFNITQETVDGTSVSCPSLPGVGAPNNTFMAAGNRAIYVNEAAGAPPSIPNAGAGNLNECNGTNNWTVFTNGMSCTGCAIAAPGSGPQHLTYTGVCQPGYHVEWRYLIFDVTGGEVTFTATMAPSLGTDAGFGMQGAPVLVADPPVAPTTSSCQLAGPSPCPIDLMMALGAQALDEQMTLDIVPQSAAASALDWSVSYDCIPFE